MLDPSYLPTQAVNYQLRIMRCCIKPCLIHDFDHLRYKIGATKKSEFNENYFSWCACL